MTANPYDRDERGSKDQRSDESEDNTQVADAGVPGQIAYPDREVNAERAAAYAAGKEETLYEDGQAGWQNPADAPGNLQGEPGEPGDETGEETEPEGVGGNPYGGTEEENK